MIRTVIFDFGNVVAFFDHGRAVRQLARCTDMDPVELALQLYGSPVEVIRTDPRCRITTLDPDTGRKEFDTLKVIAAYRGTDPEGGLPFGVYAEVIEPGAVRVGDPVRPLPG